ncbi:hypothetical protein FRC03_009256 [Tulasnella sp. 419]|nr:hypothetical protein FRC02_008207 [Tulasnella sp. 418]KAG8958322.1 hypothetical protein FRC03_009256 [Tulasnella sp. 419]
MDKGDSRMEEEAPVCLPEQAFQDVLGALLRYSHLAKGDDLGLSSSGHESYSTQLGPILEQLDAEASQLKQLSNLFQGSLERHITEIIRRRNHFLPINRLPPEILAIIFQYVQGGEADDDVAMIAVMRVAKVCYRWWSIATSNAQLWTIITSFFPLTLIESIISRSKDVPLRISLYGRGDYPNAEQIFDLIQPHIARWKSLHIISKTYDELFRQRVGDAWMPCLEEFIGYAFDVPAAVLYKAPRLQSLMIDQFKFPSEAPSFSALRIFEFAAFGEEDFSSIQWQSLLSAAPQLEHIHATSPSNFLEVEPVASPFHVELRNLKTIILEHIPLTVASALLRSISVPQGTYPRVEAQYPIGFSNPRGFHALFVETIPANNLLGVIRSMTWMSIQCNQSNWMMVTQAGVEPEVSCWISEVSYGALLAPSTVFETLVPPFGLPTLQSLTLGGEVLFRGGVFLRSLPSFPNLTSLFLDYAEFGQDEQNNLADILAALSSPSLGNRGAAIWLLPHLKYLGVRSARAVDLVLPLIEARYGSDQITSMPHRLEVLRLEVLRTSDGSNDPSLISKLQRATELLGIGFQITVEE